MAYTDPWDEATPLGSSAADTLDTIIQQHKRSLRERLEAAFPDWADDAIDPKRVVVHSGLQEDRPLVGDSNNGEIYLATDTGALFTFDGVAWLEVNAKGLSVLYDDAQIPGAKATSELPIVKTLALEFSGSTDASGHIMIDSGEIDTEGYDFTNSLVRVYQPKTLGGAHSIQEFTFSPSTITLAVFDISGSLITLTAVVVMCYFTFED